MSPARLEIALKQGLYDPAGAGLKSRALDYFGIRIREARLIRVYTFDLELSQKELETVRTEILTNPVTEVSSFAPLAREFDRLIWVGFRPGVKDNPGDTAKEAVANHFRRSFPDQDKIFTSQLYVLRGELRQEQTETLARELLANGLIQQWRVFSPSDWDPEQGLGLILPKVELSTKPGFSTLAIPDDAALMALSDQRSLSLHPADAPVIRDYFQDPGRIAAREKVGLGPQPTDVELEYLSQARSDHCNHNTFQGLFTYTEMGESPDNEKPLILDNLFKTCIKDPTLAIQAQKDWIVSVLWDNAGAAAFDDRWLYTITGETHNSPSNMEAYGGAITGIVGVYRDPMGTGLGSKLILGTYGFCVGPRDYKGPLKPELHPRRLLDGVIAGVKDGGNKSGVPTGFGLLHFDPAYLGKCLVYVTALGLMPRKIKGREAWKKKPNPGDLIVMAGGRVGKDGIHGVTASSSGYSDKTPAGHVQIGDPYTQKKLHDFILEVRDEGLISFITDNGGGGLSSSVGESARLSGGAEVQLEKVPLKYAGLELWEIWVSESQERMTLALPPENEARFFELAKKHDVEATVIGGFNDSGQLKLTHEGVCCALVDIDFADQGFPQWEFQAVWNPPRNRGLTEPVIQEPKDFGPLLAGLLASPNLAQKNWIIRQYDHEVQAGAAIKPLCGIARDIPSDAVVYRPVLDSERGLALSQCLNPSYGRIDTYHMTAATMDEALRRLVAVGADPDRVGAVDNFCWPSIQHHPKTNPDGKYKAAQLVRSALALKDTCLAFGIPLLSGKDSMYVDGLVEGPYGERRKVSGPCTLQITATSILDDVKKAVSLEPKAAGDLVYILGRTADELGGSAFYELAGPPENRLGLNVPQADPQRHLALYRAYHRAVGKGLVRSAKALTRGGLAVATALACFGSGLGLELELSALPTEGRPSDAALLFGESCGRLLVSVAPEDRERFEKTLAGHDLALLGKVTAEPVLKIVNPGRELLKASLADLKQAWEKLFGGLV